MELSFRTMDASFEQPQLNGSHKEAKSLGDPALADRMSAKTRGLMLYTYPQATQLTSSLLSSTLMFLANQCAIEAGTGDGHQTTGTCLGGFVQNVATPWWCDITLEHGPFIVDLPIQNGNFP